MSPQASAHKCFKVLSGTESKQAGFSLCLAEKELQYSRERLDAEVTGHGGFRLRSPSADCLLIQVALKCLVYNGRAFADEHLRPATSPKDVFRLFITPTTV